MPRQFAMLNIDEMLSFYRTRISTGLFVEPMASEVPPSRWCPSQLVKFIIRADNALDVVVHQVRPKEAQVSSSALDGFAVHFNPPGALNHAGHAAEFSNKMLLGRSPDTFRNLEAPCAEVFCGQNMVRVHRRNQAGRAGRGDCLPVSGCLSYFTPLLLVSVFCRPLRSLCSRGDGLVLVAEHGADASAPPFFAAEHAGAKDLFARGPMTIYPLSAAMFLRRRDAAPQVRRVLEHDDVVVDSTSRLFALPVITGVIARAFIIPKRRRSSTIIIFVSGKSSIC